jgi:hypothetical protein
MSKYMHKLIASIFEPLWFIMITILFVIKNGDSDFRKEFDRTGLSKLKLIRYSSKRASGALPYVMLFTLTIGFSIGFLSNISVANGLIGAIIAYAFLVLIPILMPTPSMLADKYID